MTVTFPRTNDSHRNAQNYRIDSQTPENTSHFAMQITLFSSLVQPLTRLTFSSLLLVDFIFRFLITYFDICTALMFLFL